MGFYWSHMLLLARSYALLPDIQTHIGKTWYINQVHIQSQTFYFLQSENETLEKRQHKMDTKFTSGSFWLLLYWLEYPR